jgi:hypothetical protein
MLGQGSITQGTIIEPGDAPDTFIVQTDAEFSDGTRRVNVFKLEAKRLRALPG